LGRTKAVAPHGEVTFLLGEICPNPAPARAGVPRTSVTSLTFSFRASLPSCLDSVVAMVILINTSSITNLEGILCLRRLVVGAALRGPMRFGPHQGCSSSTLERPFGWLVAPRGGA